MHHSTSLRQRFFLGRSAWNWVGLLLLWTSAVGAQTISTVGGTGLAGGDGDGQQATAAQLNAPVSIAVDTANDWYIADSGNHKIRRINVSGFISTVAGTGSSAASGLGALATNASLGTPLGISLNTARDVYISDSQYHYVLKVDHWTGNISAVAGTGVGGFSGDGGSAATAQLNGPAGLFVDGSGQVYIADRDNHRIRKIDTAGGISTVAGTGVGGFSGDGEAATSAQLDAPTGVFVDLAGHLYIADRGNHRVRKVDATSGLISTVAGNGIGGFSGDGQLAIAAQLDSPNALCADSTGVLYIADSGNHRIRKVETSGVISTVAGTGIKGFSGDGGPAESAQLNKPSGVFISGDALLVADTDNHRIRRIAPIHSTSPLVESSPAVGLDGIRQVSPGGEVRLWSIGLTGDGAQTVESVSLTLSDLAAPSGIESANIRSLRLYASADTALSSDDTLLSTLSTPPLGVEQTLAIAPSDMPSAGSERFYIVSALMDTVVAEGRAFRVESAAGSMATSVGALGAAVVAADSQFVRVEVVADRLTFVQLSADSSVVDSEDRVVSSKPFTQQPQVAAVDAYGNVDRDFIERVILSLAAGNGTLSGVLTRPAVEGVVDYGGSDVSYAAVTDGEQFVLSCDDESGGVDLSQAVDSLGADVVATRLAFAKQPADLVEPGENFARDTVVVVAQNALGVTDMDYVDFIHLSAVSALDSALQVDSLVAVPADSLMSNEGRAGWTDVSFAQADRIRLRAESAALQVGMSDIVSIPGRVLVGVADSIVVANALDGLAGVGGRPVVLEAVTLQAVGERVPLHEVRLRPQWGGFDSQEVVSLDIMADLDADGMVDADERSVLVHPLQPSGSGVELRAALTDTLPANQVRHYLIVASIDPTLRARDSLRVDLVGLEVGLGLVSGGAPVLSQAGIDGRMHVTTGYIDMISAVLGNPRSNQRTALTLTFDTVSNLLPGEEIVVAFPLTYDVSDVQVDAATQTPSGMDPLRSDRSQGQTVVLELAAAETKGRFSIVLNNVQTPTVNPALSLLGVQSRDKNGWLLDADDPQPLSLSLMGRGEMRVEGLQLWPHHVGAHAALHVEMHASTALDEGDEVVLDFPFDVDLRGVEINRASTPSGNTPTVRIDSAAHAVVLILAAPEEAGVYALALEGIGLPESVRSDRILLAYSRTSDGYEIDRPAEASVPFVVAGQIAVDQGVGWANGLMGRAGVGGREIPLTAFELSARGEEMNLRDARIHLTCSGLAAGALSGVALGWDRNANGLFDASDSLLARSTDLVGAQGRFALALGAFDIGKEPVHYVVLGDMLPAIRAGDPLHVTIDSLSGAVGQASGIMVAARPSDMLTVSHTATGYVDVLGIDLEQDQANAQGALAVTFTTATALEAGTQLHMLFPEGFDLSQVQLLGVRSSVGTVEWARLGALSTRRLLVLEPREATEPGSYVVEMDGVINSAAGVGLSIEISTQRIDGRVLDGMDPTPVRFDVVERALPLSCRADFNGDGRVYFSDLFLLSDAMGAVSPGRFDLNEDRRVDIDDFFLLSEVFAQRCEGDGGGNTGLALRRVDELGNGVELAFVLVRAGSFYMGSPPGEVGRIEDEGPQHRVTFTRDIYVGETEVTQAQWTAVMGTRPWLGQPAVLDEGDHPAVYIAWYDAQAFVARLNEAAGDSLYRLPSEAEWEYAARAGTDARWSFGDDESMVGDYAWTRTVPPVVSELITHPVATRRPNPWGLYDVHGSASEWVQDRYGLYGAGDAVDPQGPEAGSARVLRGGGALLSVEMTRSASRASFAPDVRLSTFGLRLVRRIP